MIRSLRSSIAAAVTLLLVVVGFVALGSSTPVSAEQNGKMFDPGLIISDSVFFDFGTMTVTDIQRFLDSKVPICNANDGGPTCLRYYKMDTQAKAGEVGRCTPLPAKKSQTAAQIIYDISHACGINPRVLIVLLQKEQGLVQATNPTTYMYKAATGYGCPDSNPAICGKGSVITGLFNQLYRAAGQFQWYGDPAGSFTYLKPGKNVSILYNPTATCGKKTFLLKNQATANLYYYTPYTPNDIALKNLYGSGDKCSAYGNRNFWRFYSDWFGSTIGGGFLLKSANSDTFLIVDNKKYLIDDQSLIDSLAPLGPLGVISNEYLDSFTNAGTLTKLVKSSAGTLYVIDGGKKFTVADCTVALSLSLDCTKAVVLTSNQLAALPAGGSATALIVDADGSRYLIDDGTKRQILDDASVTAEGITLPAKSGLSIKAFAELPWGVPVAKAGSMFVNKTSGNAGVYIGGQFVELDPTLAKTVDFGKWFTKSNGTLNASGLSQVYSNEIVKPVVSSTAGTFVITSTGKRQLSNPAQFGADASAVNSAFVNAIASAGESLTAPLLVQSAAGTKLIAQKQLRSVATTVDLKELKLKLGNPVDSFTELALSQFTSGPVVFAPGAVLLDRSSGIYYAVDAYNRLISFKSKASLELLFNRTARAASAADIKANKRVAYPGAAVECNGVVAIPWYSELLPIDAAALSQWPVKPMHLSQQSCANKKIADSKVGLFVIDDSTDAGYYISGGQKHLIKSKAIYKALLGTGIPYTTVQGVLLAGVPKGADATASVTPTGKTYKVVSGDTLGGIAARFNTTVAKLKALNRLTSDVIQVGQVLAIP